ncbi:hypothetical protein [Planctomyces sp. SH-PL14]|uniref:hypothetical protein n=1 Tax=Planctomyces sp. SH-PL14 TaxID=1632864 RepID=UPI00078B6563|nr:hypothetical protein [Planctomyces sp. SH-PL14]AMV20500.1 hypothetical protein VT03_21560 [Planctomyces sp. SH-PL14]
MTSAGKTLEAADEIDALLLRLEQVAAARPSLAEFHRQAAEHLLAGLGIDLYRAVRWDGETASLLYAQGETAEPPEATRVARATEGVQIRREAGGLGTTFAVATSRSDLGAEVLEVRYPGRLEGVLERRMGQVFEAVGEIVAEFGKQDRARSVGGLAIRWPQVDLALQGLFAAGRGAEGAGAICTALQTVLGADRVSLLVRRGGGYRVVNSSVPAVTERRTRGVKLLEALCEQAARRGQSFQFEHGAATIELRPGARRALQDYVAESLVRRIRIQLVPSKPGGRDCPALLVTETFRTETPDDVAGLETLIAPHAEQAVRLWWDRSGRSLWDRMARSGLWGRGAKVLAVVAGLAAVIGLAVTQKTTFYVEADGRLLPRERASVYAPADGFVAELFVKHGQSLEKETPLLRVQDPELDRTREKLLSDVAAWEARVSGIKTLRTQGQFGGTGGNQTRAELAELSVEEEQLLVQIKGARRQLQVIDDERGTLTVRADQAGVVDGWNIEQTLPLRPVRRGQHLMDVLDVAGPWNLELEIPDESAGYIRAAGKDGSSPGVRFLLRSQPLQEYSGRLVRWNDATELGAGGELILRGFAEYDQKALAEPQAGATVTAKIDCGERSYAFVWTRRLLEYLYRTFVL